jgi:membrane fusion protein (multidrug efflux system)
MSQVLNPALDRARIKKPSRGTVLFIAALLAVFLLLAGIKFFQIRALIASAASFGPRPEAVTTATVREETWQPTIEAVGSLTAVQGVTVSAEAPGKVVKIFFEAGATVKAGDPLVQIDTSVEEAQLRSAEANVSLMQLSLDRARKLRENNTTSQADLDSADAQAKQAVAQADNMRATIAKKNIRAPFDGRLGIRLVNLGQTLKEGDAIVSLQALDPIYGNFLLPQQRLTQLAVGQPVRLTTDALGDVVVEGKITAINPDVDSATRNIRVQATFANAGERLRPGMYATLSVVLPSQEKILTIPGTSILHATYEDKVFVVEKKKNEKTGKDEDVVREQPVRLGERRGDFVAVTSGLKAGETVVSSGVFKLHKDAAVLVNNSLSPDAQLAPKPEDN